MFRKWVQATNLGHWTLIGWLVYYLLTADDIQALVIFKVAGGMVVWVVIMMLFAFSEYYFRKLTNTLSKEDAE